MRSFIKSIPNIITSLNLLSGSLAVLAAIEGNLIIAAILIAIASVFDFMDGMAARILKAYSEIGKQLDSLADLISFGLAPSVIIYGLMKLSTDAGKFHFDISFTSLLLVLPFLIVIFSAYRLAKFNLDDRQTNSFIGLPTPANALLIASLPLMLKYSDFVALKDILLNTVFLSVFIVVSSYLLVSNIPMFSLKFSNLRFKENQLRYVFLGVSLALIIVFQAIALTFIIILYILLSVFNSIVSKKQVNK